MSNFELVGIFPAGVVLSTEMYKFSKEELDFFKKQKSKSHTNIYNRSSDERYLLNDPLMKNVTDFILSGITHYIANVIAPHEPLEFYITQSWLNWTKPGEGHHMHNHANSIISGVLYVNADIDTDRINFYNNKYDRINIPTTKFNVFNSDTWWFPVGTGKLVLFDSSLQHAVESTKSKETRVSLAFNTFVRGQLGAEFRNTGVYLK